MYVKFEKGPYPNRQKLKKEAHWPSLIILKRKKEKIKNDKEEEEEESGSPKGMVTNENEDYVWKVGQWQRGDSWKSTNCL